MICKCGDTNRLSAQEPISGLHGASLYAACNLLSMLLTTCSSSSVVLDSRASNHPSVEHDISMQTSNVYQQWLRCSLKPHAQLDVAKRIMSRGHIVA